MLSAHPTITPFIPDAVDPSRECFYVVTRVEEHDPSGLSLRDEELAKAARFYREEDKTAYMVRHGLLNMFLSAFLGKQISEWTLEKTAKGKPYLPGTPFHFSMSRSGQSLAFAFGPAEIGIDIECIRDAQPFQLVVNSHFFPAEKAAYAQARSDDFFFSIWTRKEAILKAAGTGLDAAIDQLNTLNDQTTYGGNEYHFSTHHLGHCMVSLAVKDALRAGEIAGYRL